MPFRAGGVGLGPAPPLPVTVQSRRSRAQAVLRRPPEALGPAHCGCAWCATGVGPTHRWAARSPRAVRVGTRRAARAGSATCAGPSWSPSDDGGGAPRRPHIDALRHRIANGISSGHNRLLGNVQIHSVSASYEDPKLLPSLLSLYTKADAMGLLPSRPIVEVSPTTLKAVLKAYQSRGLLGTLQTRLEALLKDPRSERSTTEAVSALSEVLKAVDESPVPDKEWPAMRRVFDDDNLAQLLSVSSSSLKRYGAGGRQTPDHIADRVHWLAMVVAALSGSYNDIGIRRWFERPRAQLNEKTPRQVLGRNWNPSAQNVRRVRDLAESLVSTGAT